MTTCLCGALHELDMALMEQAGGVSSPQMRKLINDYAKDVSRYFKEMFDDFPYGKLDGLVKKYGPKEEEANESFFEQAGEEIKGLATASETIAEEMVKKHNKKLGVLSYTYLLEGFELGGEGALRLLGVTQVGVVDEGFKNWCRSHAAKLVKVVDEVTTERISKTVYEGVRTGSSPQRLAKDLRKEMAWQADAYKGRPMTIARTEMANANSEAALRTYERLGVEYKSWSRAGSSDFDCDICQANEDAGIIPMEESFPSGDDRPPAHPNCECVLVPETKKE